MRNSDVDYVARSEKVRPFLADADLDVKVPLSVDVNLDTYDVRRGEGVLELRGGLCPYFRIPGEKEIGCNHCSLPLYSAGRRVDSESLKVQIYSAFDSLWSMSGGKDVRTVSMYNGGSAFNAMEISRDALSYFFSEAARYRDGGVFPSLNRVSVESRETFVSRDLLGRSVDALDGITLEVALGCESYDDAVRNGDVDNSRGMIGLNKRIDLGKFERAVGLIGDAGAEAKFYVMMGAVPWLSQREVVDDVLGTVGYLYDLSNSNGIPTFVHLNPMYAAKGSALCDVWEEACLEGKKLPDYFDVVEVLEGIDSSVAKFGTDGFRIYLGLDSEGLGEGGVGEEFRSALADFNRTQDLESLVCFKEAWHD